jgi:hypothetical protein
MTVYTSIWVIFSVSVVLTVHSQWLLCPVLWISLMSHIAEQASDPVKDKFWEELIAYFPLIRHGPYKIGRLQQFLVAAGTCLPSRFSATIHTQTHRVMGGIYEVRY